MSIIVGNHPVPMTVILVQGSSASLVVPSDTGVMSAPVLEFATENASATVLASHTLALESGQWIVHLTSTQIAALKTAKVARVKDGARTVAAGPVDPNAGWEGRALRSNVVTRIIFGGGPGGPGGVTDHGNLDGLGDDDHTQYALADGTRGAFATTGHTHTSANISDFTEAAQDAIAALLAGASGVTLNYDDVANTLTITGGGAGGLDAEAVRDAIGVAMVGTGAITVTVNDDLDTITISTTATANSTDAALRNRETHTGTQDAVTIGDSTTVGRAVLTSVDMAAARAAIAAGTSNLAVGTGAADAKAGNYQPAAVNISDSTTVGRAMLTAANAASARLAAGIPAEIVDGVLEGATGGGLAWTAGSAVVAKALGWEVVTAPTHAKVQAAADAAQTAGKKIYAAGAYTTTETLTLACNADLSGLTINYTGPGVAVKIGGPAYPTLTRITVHLGHIKDTAKTAGASWRATTGLEIRNLFRSQIHIQNIVDFGTGLLLVGDGTYANYGVSYCTFHIGTLANNLVNQSHQIVPGGGVPFVNENVFLGGAWSHQDGTYPVSGMRHIVIGTSGGTGSLNNNLWLGASLEGTREEYLLDIHGTDNMWIGCRWEFPAPGGPVRWGPTAARNLILGGYMANQLSQTPEAGSISNNIIGTNTIDFASASDGGVTLSNATGGTASPLVLMPAGWRTSGLTPAAGYNVRFQHGRVMLKNTPDTSPRFDLDVITRSITLGAGISADKVGIYWGSGSPQGAITAPPGSIFLRYNSTAGVRRWIKKSGTGNTGWQPDEQVATTKTASYTLVDGDTTVIFNGATLTATLPSATVAGADCRYAIKNINASALTVGATAGTIDGAATQSLAQWAKSTYMSDGTNWLSI